MIIYKIYCKLNGMIYVGQTTRFNCLRRTKASLPNLVAKKRKLKFLRQTNDKKYQAKLKHTWPPQIKSKNLAKPRKNGGF